ncbi:MAG: hypothetical protein AB2814_00790, partial [Candidatus Sedimenticola endophacoides]
MTAGRDATHLPDTPLRPPQRLPQRLQSPSARLTCPQECRYLVKDFGTSQSPKSTRQRDSRYCPD